MKKKPIKINLKAFNFLNLTQVRKKDVEVAISGENILVDTNDGESSLQEAIDNGSIGGGSGAKKITYLVSSDTYHLQPNSFYILNYVSQYNSVDIYLEGDSDRAYEYAMTINIGDHVPEMHFMYNNYFGTAKLWDSTFRFESNSSYEVNICAGTIMAVKINN